MIRDGSISQKGNDAYTEGNWRKQLTKQSLIDLYRHRDYTASRPDLKGNIFMRVAPAQMACEK